MKLLISQLSRRLAALFVAVAFVFAALGLNASVAHATQSATLCNGFVSETLRVEQELTHSLVLKTTQATMGKDHISNQSKTDSSAMKSPCCSSFCTPAFFAFCDSLLKDVDFIENSKWHLRIAVLNSTDSDSLKRPPRLSFLQI